MFQRHESDRRASSPTGEPSPTTTAERAHIGRSMVFTGELTGSEHLTIDGRVEGTVILREHAITVGLTGKVKAEISAKAVIVLGQVTGNITATEKVEMHEKSRVEGDIATPRVVIAPGAHFRGRIDTQASLKTMTPRPATRGEPARSRPAATTRATAQV